MEEDQAMWIEWFLKVVRSVVNRGVRSVSIRILSEVREGSTTEHVLSKPIYKSLFRLVYSDQSERCVQQELQSLCPN